jgi:hypothetical protein
MSSEYNIMKNCTGRGIARDELDESKQQEKLHLCTAFTAPDTRGAKGSDFLEGLKGVPVSSAAVGTARGGKLASYAALKQKGVRQYRPSRVTSTP